MKNWIKDNEVDAVQVAEWMVELIPAAFASHDKFLDTYPKGSMLYIPTNYRTQTLKEIFLRYDETGVYACSIRNMQDSILGFRLTADGDEMWYNNEISVHDKRFYISQHDNGCHVRMDSTDNMSPKCEMRVDIESDTCYHSGETHGGVEETLFLYSLEHGTRTFAEVKRELDVCTKIVETLQEGTEIFSDATDFADITFYQNVLPGIFI